MGRKLKFRPKITRIKLNPEQAVLSCTCYMGLIAGTGTPADVICSNLGTKDTRTAKWQAGESALS